MEKDDISSIKSELNFLYGLMIENSTVSEPISGLFGIQTEFDALFENFKKKLSIALFGMTNSGKSTLLNALIGKEILEHDTQECTFFGTKIRASLQPNMKFYEHSDESKKFESFEEIQKQIKFLNKEQRAKIQKEKDLWALETELKAFTRSKTFNTIKDIYEFIEFIDLPGVDDIDLKDVKETDEFTTKKTVDCKFGNVLEKMDVDAFIIVLDYKNQDSIKKFFEYFKFQLFQGKNKKKLQELLSKKRLLIAVNKVETLEKEGFKEKKIEIETKIFTHLLIPKASKVSEFFEKLFSKNEEINLKSSLKYGPDDFQRKCQEFPPVVFISSAEAKKTFKKLEEMIAAKKKDLEIKKYTEEEIKDIIDDFREEESKNQQFDYNENSNFEEFINVLSSLLLRITNDKIIKPMKEFRENLFHIKNLDLLKKDKECDLTKKFNAIQQEISEICEIFIKESLDLLSFYSEIGEMILVLPKEKCLECVDFISNLIAAGKQLEILIRKTIDSILKRFSNSNILIIMGSVLNHYVKPFFLGIEKASEMIIDLYFVPKDLDPNLISLFYVTFKNLETFFDKNELSSLFKQKMNDLSYEEKHLAFKRIYENLTTQITGFGLALKHGIEKVLEEYKKINKIN